MIALGSLRLEGFPHNDGVSVVVATSLGQQELRMSIGDWASLQRLVDVLAAADRQHANDRAELLRMDMALARIQPIYEAAKAYVERERAVRAESAEISERLNRGEVVSLTLTVSSLPASHALEQAVDAAVSKEQAL